MKALISFFLMVSAWSHGETRTVHFTTDPWPPYVYGKDGQTAESGMIKDLIEAIFARIDGYDAVIDMRPWKRSIQSVKDGSKDGIPQLRYKEDRLEFMVFSEAMFDSNTVFYYRTDKLPENFSWVELKDLAPYRIGIIEGHSVSAWLTDQAAQQSAPLQFDLSNKESFAYSRFLAGRTDMIAVEEITGLTRLRAQILRHEVQLADKPVYSKPYHLSLSRKSGFLHLLPEINRSIKELKQQGIIQALLNKMKSEVRMGEK